MIGRSAVLTLCCAALFIIGCHGQDSEAGKQDGTLNSPRQTAAFHIFANIDGDQSFLYVKEARSGISHRLTSRKRGWETDGVVSLRGDAVAYALADGPEAKSEVWISASDGGNAHRVSGADEDALMPAFAPDGKVLLYAKSRFNGHYSPIARPRRHKFDIVKVLVNPAEPIPGAAPIELTQQEFFDLQSLSVSPDGERFLVSTSGYPIGSLIEEFELAKPFKIKKIFQPHVPSEPTSGASFGQAAYLLDGMQIVFTAASEGKGTMFDYNVYQMSDVTGGDLVRLTQHAGMIDEMSVGQDGTIFFSGSGKHYSIDPHTRALQLD